MNEVSISRLVNSIFYDYDRSGNGTIDLKAKSRDESYFDTKTVRETPNETVITVTRYFYDELFI